jgi:hypothetical protein
LGVSVGSTLSVWCYVITSCCSCGFDVKCVSKVLLHASFGGCGIMLPQPRDGGTKWGSTDVRSVVKRNVFNGLGMA